MQLIRHIFGLMLFLFVFAIACEAIIPFSERNTVDNANHFVLRQSVAHKLSFSNDSKERHRLSFRYPDEKKGIKPWLTPVTLIAGGVLLHFSDNIKENVNICFEKNLAYHGKPDNYIQFAPLAASYILFAAGVQGKNNFGNKTAIAVKSFLLDDFITYQLKKHVNEYRPNGEKHSFPSGHTSKAFAFAHFMHREYGELSPWYSIGAYSAAATVGFLRLTKSAHWISDVVAGAGIGILSTELIYLTHQYKWDNEHLKRFDIFPFRLGKQKGVTLTYTF